MRPVSTARPDGPGSKDVDLFRKIVGDEERSPDCAANPEKNPSGHAIESSARQGGRVCLRHLETFLDEERQHRQTEMRLGRRDSNLSGAGNTRSPLSTVAISPVTPNGSIRRQRTPLRNSSIFQMSLNQ